jgi:hypothetical protein
MIVAAVLVSASMIGRLIWLACFPKGVDQGE